MNNYQAFIKQYSIRQAFDLHEFQKKCLQMKKFIFECAVERKKEVSNAHNQEDQVETQTHVSSHITTENQDNGYKINDNSKINLHGSQKQHSSLEVSNASRRHEPESNQGDNEQNIDIIYQYFANELRPQIKAKYPSAPSQKVDKVILQKWNTIDTIKKEAFIKKIQKKIELQKKNKQQQKNKQEIVVKRQQMQETKTEHIKTSEDKFNNLLHRLSNNTNNDLKEPQLKENQNDQNQNTEEQMPQNHRFQEQKHEMSAQKMYSRDKVQVQEQQRRQYEENGKTKMQQEF